MAADESFDPNAEAKGVEVTSIVQAADRFSTVFGERIGDVPATNGLGVESVSIHPHRRGANDRGRVGRGGTVSTAGKRRPREGCRAPGVSRQQSGPT